MTMGKSAVVPVDDLRPRFSVLDRATGEDVTEFVLSGHGPCGDSFRNRGQFRVVTFADVESITQQAPASSTDIDLIWERCTRDGIQPWDLPEARMGQYADVSELQSADLTVLIERSRATTLALEEFAKDWRPAPPEESPEPGSGDPPGSGDAAS